MVQAGEAGPTSSYRVKFSQRLQASTMAAAQRSTRGPGSSPPMAIDDGVGDGLVDPVVVGVAALRRGAP